MDELIIIALLAVFRIAREVEDWTVRGNNKAFFPNSSEAWTAKWQYPLRQFSGWWYAGLYRPKYAERYPYSSTLLVWTTDREHLWQAVQTVALVATGFVAGIGWLVVIGLVAGSVIKEFLKID